MTPIEVERLLMELNYSKHIWFPSNLPHSKRSFLHLSLYAYYRCICVWVGVYVSMLCTCNTNRLKGLTWAHVDLRPTGAVVARGADVETLAVLPHPLPPQEKEELGLARHTPIVLRTNWAAFADWVNIASWNTRQNKNIGFTEQYWSAADLDINNATSIHYFS